MATSLSQCLPTREWYLNHVFIVLHWEWNLCHQNKNKQTKNTEEFPAACSSSPSLSPPGQVSSLSQKMWHLGAPRKQPPAAGAVQTCLAGGSPRPACLGSVYCPGSASFLFIVCLRSGGLALWSEWFLSFPPPGWRVGRTPRLAPLRRLQSCSDLKASPKAHLSQAPRGGLVLRVFYNENFFFLWSSKPEQSQEHRGDPTLDMAQTPWGVKPHHSVLLVALFLL